MKHMFVTSSHATSPLRVSEIFASIQGESTRIGLPTVFVRLTGCPLRCTWCDTEYAFQGGTTIALEDIVSAVSDFSIPHVCVTGGEPLAQKACLELLTALCDRGLSVSIETSGALDVSKVDTRVSKIMDLKAPGSGECERNKWENLAHLNGHDEIKVVIADESDYDWALRQLSLHRLNERCTILFSPVHGQLDPAQLAEWIIRDRLPVRFQMQLHKVLWSDARGR